MQFSFEIYDAAAEEDVSEAVQRLTSAVNGLQSDGYLVKDRYDKIEIVRSWVDHPLRVDVTFRIADFDDISHVQAVLDNSVSALRDNNLIGHAE